MKFRFLALIIFLLAAGLTGFVHAQMPARARADLGEAFVPDPAMAGRMTLGFDAVLSEYYWLVAIQAVGGQAAKGCSGGPDGGLGSGSPWGVCPVPWSGAESVRLNSAKASGPGGRRGAFLLPLSGAQRPVKLGQGHGLGGSWGL